MSSSPTDHAPREVRWERMFPDELEAALAARPLVYLPYGLCEPHGPQNAVGLDGHTAHGVSVAAARRGGGVVAPPVWWHCNEFGPWAAWAHRAIGEARPWLTAVPPWVFFKNMLYHLRACAALGFKAALVHTGHGGPHQQDFEPFVAAVQPHFAMRVEIMAWWDMPEVGSVTHAGHHETSLHSALHPDCVDTGRLPEPGDDSGAPWFAMGPDAHQADRRFGQDLLRRLAALLDQRATALLKTYTGECEADPIRSFMDVERVWRDELLPQIPDWHCMQPSQVPKDSQWAYNAPVPDPV